MNTLVDFLTSTAPHPFADRKRTVKRSMRSRHVRRPIANPVKLRRRNTHPETVDQSSRRRLVPDILLTLVFIALSLFLNLAAINTTEFHPDESRWLNRAYYIRDLRDPFGPTWQEYVTTTGQPPLGSYVMGIGLALQGKDLDGTGVWDFAYGEEWNEFAGAVPSDEDLKAGRRTNAVIGALVVGSAYVLGRLLTNRVGGSIAALFLAFQPLHITLSSQALSDETLALVLMLSFIVAWFFARRPTWSRAIVLGILLGLGGAVKLAPLLLGVPLAMLGLMRWGIHRDRESRDYAVKLLAQPIIAFATFVASYPYLWPSPIRRTYDLYVFRATEMVNQSAAWPENAVEHPLDALTRFGTQLTYTYSTSQRAIQALYNQFGIDRVANGYDYIPAVAGFLILLWWVVERGLWTPTALVAVLMGAQATVMIMGMKTDFYRYHLPILVIMCGCIAVSAGVAWSVLVTLVRQSRRPTENASVQQSGQVSSLPFCHARKTPALNPATTREVQQ